MNMLIYQRYVKSNDWAALYWFATVERAGWWNPLACNAGLSPRSCRLNQSRVRRVTPLTVLDVSASEKRAVFGELRVVPRKECLSSRLWDDGLFLIENGKLNAENSFIPPAEPTPSLSIFHCQFLIYTFANCNIKLSISSV